MLRRSPWPNKLGFDLLDSGTICASVLDDPTHDEIVLVSVELDGSLVGHFGTKHLSLPRTVEMFGRDVILPFPPDEVLVDMIDRFGAPCE